MSLTSRHDAWRLVGLALGLGLLLALGRGAVLYGLDALGRGHDPISVLWRIEARLPLAQAVALPLGFVLALLATTRTLPGWITVPAGALLATVYWSGLGYDDAFHIPDSTTSRGQAALAALGAAGLLLSFAARAGVDFIPVGRRVLFAGLLGSIGLPVLFAPVVERLSGGGRELPMVRVALDFTQRRDLWREVQGSPRATSMTPVIDYKFDGGDRAAIQLDPTGSLTLVVPELGEGDLVFRCAGGAHHTTGTPGPLTVRFTVEHDETIVLDETRTFERGAAKEQRSWLRVGGSRGLAVEPGDELRLSTELVAGSPVEEDRIGFGECVLQRITRTPRERSSPEAPNLVVVVMDTLRADRTSLHGYERPTTPVLDDLAVRGTTFREAWATSSWTWPSTASILTGLEPPAHGVTSIFSCTLSHDLTSLPELLQERGYTTGGFSGNPLIVADKAFDQGFEHFQGAQEAFLASSVLVPDVLAWIERQAGRRFFAYVHLVDPHEPHRPRPEFEKQFTRGKPADLPHGALTAYAEQLWRETDPAQRAEIVPGEHARWLDEVYDACVASGDYWLGEILGTLASLGLDDETIVVFTSDHGEELLDHGLYKHGHALHRELMHVPLVIAGPGVPAGVVHTTPVSNRHLAPTLARLGGTRFEGLEGAIDLLGEVPEESLLLTSETGWHGGKGRRSLIGWRRGDSVVHGLLEDDGTTSLLGAYALDEDPLELVPDGLDPILAESLLQRARDRREALARQAPATRAGGAGTTKVLQGIGYLESGDDETDDR